MRLAQRCGKRRHAQPPLELSYNVGMPFDPKIHHRRTIRMPAFDYASSGYYAVVICTRDKACLFGDVVDWKMHLNDVGRIAHECWMEIPNHFESVGLDEFIIMPNHMHGIIALMGRDAIVGVRHALPLRDRIYKYGQPPGSSIPSIVGSYKSAVTKMVNRLLGREGVSIWQRNYYEHVIRDERDLMTKRDYIVNNPTKWQLDKYNPINWNKP